MIIKIDTYINIQHNTSNHRQLPQQQQSKKFKKLNNNPYIPSSQMKPIPKKDTLPRKATLLRQKLLTNASITHNTYQYRIDQLYREQEEIEKRLKVQLEEFQAKVKGVVERYESDMGKLGMFYAEDAGDGADLEGNGLYRELLTAEQVKNYLNTQKNLLKQLLQPKTHSQPNSLSTIHTLLQKKHLQEHLQHLQLHRLQTQIHYLSTHVINSSGLIYVPEQNISEAEEAVLEEKLSMGLSELERLVGLEVVCGANKAGDEARGQKEILGILDQQDKRLDRVFQLLTAQKIAAQNIINSLQLYIQKIKNPPIFSSTTSAPTTKNHIQPIKPLLFPPTPQQLQQLLHQNPNIKEQEQSQTISNQTCEHEELNNNVKHLRNKLKKLE